ncbi:hypothetical protein IPC97_00705 [Pseudomonas aeruginosa]|uniref:hypothetical protein n=1 Tax=Pseudomonas aeruginosa TaxID=287 RepID=UPI000F5231D4|nr:hypothetical protein [Pseudomonas aeruginosa]MBH4336987.1 hypothetical protein [Pseudomonas aeruginosa]NPW29996.1 hypothetical protein [Pseudomonas aeruginosa]RQI00754.1 hypothetical protein IPC97_00705 [Pseudomonas aeruginosa]HCF5472860.1 hypothetical protein [Pseudomonas aeruginosa]HCL3737062.1 hypothetical protein [Pseudomonas aeruginosa]
MTAEIAIMSRTAVVLAADSATTVTSWKDGQPERRYFKGANKLFELSRSGPVGIMIYGSAGLQGVPWELPIKAFREALGKEQFDVLQTYPERFFEFVEHNDKLFSAESKSDALLSMVGAAAFRLQLLIAKNLEVSEIDDLAGKGVAEIEQALAEAENLVDGIALDDRLTDVDVANAAASTAEAIATEAPTTIDLFIQSADRHHLIPRFANLLAKLAVKQFFLYADVTGIVFAGYGKEDYFPSLEVYECFGFLGERLIFSRDDDSRAMSANSPAVIQPFATTHMIDTFRTGVSLDVFGAMHDANMSALRDVGRKVLAECGAQTPITEERLEELATEVHQAHADKWYQQMRNQHVFPLSSVVNSLPLPDMAALAKSLIELESLKERVTKPSESVSGPIDVAVISKHDGFVWIDRKHYFRPELNPRFFKRAD